MSYVRKVISRDETLISITHLHWIYLIEAFLWFVFIFGFGLLADYYLWAHAGSYVLGWNVEIWIFSFDAENTPIPWLFGFTGFVTAWPLILKYLSTEVGLTDKRIIHKTGLIVIQVQQVDLEDIRAEKVNHGWFGWVLGYGRIHFDCRFVDDLYLPAVKNPYNFVKAAHVARMRNPDIDYGEDELRLDIDHIDRLRHRQARSKRVSKAKGSG